MKPAAESGRQSSGRQETGPNKITGANAGGPRQSPMRTRWAARVAQFWRWRSASLLAFEQPSRMLA